MALSRSRPAAVGSTAAAPAIASVCFTDSSPAVAALATSGTSCRSRPHCSSLAASARVVPVVRASQSSGLRSPSPRHTADSATLAAAIDFTVRPVRSIRSPSATSSRCAAGSIDPRSISATAAARTLGGLPNPASVLHLHAPQPYEGGVTVDRGGSRRLRSWVESSILSLMAQYSATLDDVFSALADPTRRGVVGRVGRGRRRA